MQQFTQNLMTALDIYSKWFYILFFVYVISAETRESEMKVTAQIGPRKARNPRRC